MQIIAVTDIYFILNDLHKDAFVTCVNLVGDLFPFLSKNMKLKSS